MEGICDVDGSSAGATLVGPLLMLTATGYYGLSSVVAARVVAAAVVKPSTYGSDMNVSGMGESCAY